MPTIHVSIPVDGNQQAINDAAAVASSLASAQQSVASALTALQTVQAALSAPIVASADIDPAAQLPAYLFALCHQGDIPNAVRILDVIGNGCGPLADAFIAEASLTGNDSADLTRTASEAALAIGTFAATLRAVAQRNGIAL